MSILSVLKNPFPGLRPFRRSEKHLFFGREEQISNLSQKLSKNRFLAVVGNSGSGKSSLVLSGLMPLFLNENRNLQPVVLRPGNDPLHNLCDSFSKVFKIPFEEFSATLNSLSLKKVTEKLSDYLGKESKGVLVVVDQFEELFRYEEQAVNRYEIKNDVGYFIQLLLHLHSQNSFPARIVITMRYDFLGNCTYFKDLPKALSDGMYVVPKMSRSEMRSAIEGPIKSCGADITPVLLTRLLNEADDIPEQLPVLQHALMRTWGHWMENCQGYEPIDLKHYEAIGTMEEALSLHADEAFSELETVKDRRLCEIMFKRITDKRPDLQATRNPVALSEICKVGKVSEEDAERVIEVFRAEGRSFLMPPQTYKLGRDSIIDISHESLMRVWKRLNRWVKEEAESAGIFIRLSESTFLNNKEIAETGYLTTPELEICLDWYNKNKPTQSWAARYMHQLKGDVEFKDVIKFLESSKRNQEKLIEVQNRQREIEIEREKKLREQEKALHEFQKKQHQQEKKQLEEAQAQQKKYLQYAINVAWILSIAIIFSISLMIKAFENEELAENAQKMAIQERDRAKAAERLALEANTESLKEKDAAEQARDEAQNQKQLAILSRKEAESARDEALNQRKIAIEQSILAKEASEMAEREALAATIQKQRAESLAVTAKEAENQAKSAKFLAEARETAIKSTYEQINPQQAVEMALLAYDLNFFANKILGKDTLAAEPEVFNGLQNAFLLQNTGKLMDKHVLSHAFDENFLATINPGGTLEIYKLGHTASGISQITELVDSYRTSGAYVRSFVINDREIVYGTIDGKLFYINIERNEIIPVPAKHGNAPIVAMHLNGKNTMLVSASKYRINVTDIETGKIIHDFKTDERINDILVVDKKLIAINEKGQLKSWSLLNPQPDPKILFTHIRNAKATPLRSIAYNPQSNVLAVGDAFGEVVVLQLNREGIVKETTSFGKRHKGVVSTMAFNGDGDLLATASYDGTIYVWQMKQALSLVDHNQIPFELQNDGHIKKIDFSENGDFLIFDLNEKLQVRSVRPHILVKHIRED